MSSVVLPAPVQPMIAVVCPAAAVKRDVAQHRVARRPGSGTSTPRELDARRASATAVTGVGGRRRPTDSVSSTSPIRSAQTAARGTITSMKVAIMTAIRICMR